MKAFFIIFIVAVIGGMAYFWNQNGSASSGSEVTIPSGVVYYYGAECPHCKDVAAFLEENKISEKMSFEKKEVWHNKVNAAEMSKAAEICELDTEKIGVPFVFSPSDKKCYIGTPDVKEFFKGAAGL